MSGKDFADYQGSVDVGEGGRHRAAGDVSDGGERPRLLDLFCGAGGSAKGYGSAGFDVVGVDNRPQPRYPFEFIQADALDLLAELAAGAAWFSVGPDRIHSLAFDAIHASPPCQRYSRTQRLRGREHPDLVAPCRDLMRATGLPYVIENVPEAPLCDPVILCGTQFGLRLDGFELRRHRAFECTFPVLGMECRHELPAAPVFGHSPNQWFREKYGRGFDNDSRREIMGTPWIPWDEIGQAIPPVYTEHIGHYLMAEIRAHPTASTARPSSTETQGGASRPHHTKGTTG